MTRGAGYFNTWISIYHPASGGNRLAERTTAGELYRKVAARRLAPRISSGEIQSAGQERAQELAVFEIRYDANVEPRMTVVHNGKSYRIASVDDGGTVNDLTVLHCVGLQ